MKPRFGFGFRTFITEKILHLGYMIEYINKSLRRCDAKKELTVFSESTSITEKSFDWKWQMWFLNIKHSYYYYTNFVYSNKLTMKRMGKKQRWSSCCQQDILSHAGMGTWCIVFFETYYKIWMIIHKNAFSKLQSEKITAFVILTDQLLGKKLTFFEGSN